MTGAAHGMLLNFTGDGKGKSSACFGLAVRALGRDMRVALLQFIKGERETGEKRFFESLKNPLLYYETFGHGLTWTPGDHAGAARAAWLRALEFLDGRRKTDVLILDELNIALSSGFLDLDEVLAAFAKRPETLYVAVSGRGAPERLIAVSDLVSRMDEIKHPFREDIPAAPGIDF